MKVVIACLNSKYVHASPAPWCLLAGAREFCKTDADFEVLEGTLAADTDGFVSRILERAPDIVSFCCYIWNITKTLEICDKLKQKSNLRILLGGPEVAYRPREVLQTHPFVDFVLTGEGEFCFPAFIDAIFQNADLQKVCGLTFRAQDGIISVPEAVYTESPPSPVTDEYLASLGGRICYIESSRGCPYRCAFCLSGRVSHLRFFDMQTTKRDMLLLANSGTQTVKFVDRTFNASESHANEILSFILENYGKKIPKGVCFHFEIAGDILRQSTLDILSKMPKGAVQLEIGMQSFNEHTLAAVNRKTDTGKLISNIRKLVSFDNMHIHIDLIAGLPHEDIKSFEQSFDIAYGLGAHMLQLGFLKLLHGADMREKSDEYPCVFSKLPPYEVISTPALTESDIKRLKNCEDALDKLYNSGRFMLTLDYLINTVGLNPFALFCDFGEFSASRTCAVRDYAVLLYEFFKAKCDASALREKIVCDILCSCGKTQLPGQLRFEDKRHKKIKAAFSPKISFAVLPHKDVIFAVDTESARDTRGRLGFKIYDINSIIPKETN